MKIRAKPKEDDNICGAHARSTGKPCKKPPMANGRCRLHGGLSTGRPVISGYWTKTAKEQRARLRELIRSVKAALKDAKESAKQLKGFNT
jgi:hypothetical protein